MCGHSLGVLSLRLAPPRPPLCSPVAFPKRFDPRGEYVRKWLPQFAAFPAEFIYEPWRAPRAVQERHGVVVGASYPARIVVHEEVSKVNIGRHAEAYRRASGNAAEPPGGDGDASDASDAEAGGAGSGAAPARRRAGAAPRSAGRDRAAGLAGGKRARG